jgi:GntR family transcriptional regulator
MRIRIVAGSSAPIYKQIVDAISRTIATGELAVGETLPSVRQLAKELVINPNTVARAYAELVQSGLVETQAGRGFFVTKRRCIYSKTERMRRLDESIHGLIGQAIAMDFTPDEALDRVRELFEKSLRNPSHSS